MRFCDKEITGQYYAFFEERITLIGIYKDDELCSDPYVPKFMKRSKIIPKNNVRRDFLLLGRFFTGPFIDPFDAKVFSNEYRTRYLIKTLGKYKKHGLTDIQINMINSMEGSIDKNKKWKMDKMKKQPEYFV